MKSITASVNRQLQASMRGFNSSSFLFVKRNPKISREAKMEDESRELVIRIERELSNDERQEIQTVIANYPRQKGSLEIGFF